VVLTTEPGSIKEEGKELRSRVVRRAEMIRVIS